MQISNVRLGLATNSSSSHSLIFLPYPVETNEYSQFGWQYFTAADKKSKANYFGIMLYQAISWHSKNKYLASIITGAVTGDPYFDWESFTEHAYIDHNSTWGFPNEFNESSVNIKFAQDAYKWLTENNIVILGGNDNGGDEHPLKNGTEFEFPIPDWSGGTYGSDLVARWDEKYEFWTIFNRHNGARMMLRFLPTGVEKPIVDRSSTPMLVDISITDYCPFGCKFCYRGSTIKGQAAKLRDIEYIADQLAEMQVFEVALGGGEPTLYPEFVKVLKAFRKLHIVPNFTTKNLAWLRHDDLAKDIMQYAGSFAFSLSENWYNEMEEILDLIQQRKIEKNRVNLHVVMGTMKQPEVEGILKKSREMFFRVTLLGYKDDNFGADYEADGNFKPYVNWIVPLMKDLADKNQLWEVSIDTKLAQQVHDQLESAGIPAWMYHLKDGQFSMFIDAVAMKAGKSSFDGDAMVEFENGYGSQDLKRIYQSWSE